MNVLDSQLATASMPQTARETTAVLRISHRVTDYSRWKAAFDADPIGRAAAGVICHQVLRGTDDPSRVAIDLEFRSTTEASAMLAALRPMWEGVAGTLISDLEAQVIELAERHAYA